ncbi:hypothetical protein [Streptomyces sp. GSL17-111]|uniref:hypothetical protein n=1 Tax=Streptomyces sp. GSL17-111 TaxID=3121596 RepID=UPI0030F46E59
MKNAARRRRSPRIGLVAAAALGLCVTTATSASAHSVYETDTQWHNSSGNHCMLNKSQVSNGSSGGGRFDGWTESGYNEIVPFVDCEFPRERPINHLAGGMQVWKYSTAVNDWVLCARTDKTYYNSNPTFSLNLYWNAPSEGLCGPASYGLYNHSAMHSDGGWTPTFNNPIYSGTHSDLGSWGATSAAESRQPGWVNEDGTVDLSKLPRKAKVADSNGDIVTDEAGEPVMVDTRLVRTPPTQAPDDSGKHERTFVNNEDGSTTEKVEVDMVRVASTL